jgi:uncharacterized protein YjeT (DUF2065 family)
MGRGWTQAMWHDILVALALVFVVEGIWPFLNPDGLRQAMLAIAELDDRALRMGGLVSMVVGVALLYWIN